MKTKITAIIDFFYPPFRRVMPLQTFRYAACGGFNTFLGMVLYSVFYTYLFEGREVGQGHFMFKAHTASLLLSFWIIFFSGFILNKYVVFITSNLRGRIQLFRYFLSVMSNLAVNFMLLKFLVEYLHWNAIFSQGATTCVIICLSYLSQKHFSFKENVQDSE